MAFKPYRKIRVPPEGVVTSKHINDVQDAVGEALGQLLGKDALDVVLLKNIKLLPGIINTVAHGLGRVLDGWIVVRNHGSYAILTDKQDDNPSPNLLLYLTTPNAVVVDLLVF